MLKLKPDCAGSAGREASRTALRKIMSQAQASGRGSSPGCFGAILMVSMLLGVAERPTPREIADAPARPQLPSCNSIR